MPNVSDGHALIKTLWERIDDLESDIDRLKARIEELEELKDVQCDWD